MTDEKGFVWFIGAGPGDPDLITVKGQRLIRQAQLVLYAGSLVPREIVALAAEQAEVLDSSDLTLEQTHAAMRRVALAGGLVARVHTGDPMLYGAVPEQMALLDAEGIPYGVVPGVSAAFAASASAMLSLTIPEQVQSFAITRMNGNTPVPEGQRVADYARLGGSLAVYLSAAEPEALEQELCSAGLPEDTPILIAHRVGWPDEYLVQTTLAKLASTTRKHNFTRQTVFLILPGEKKTEHGRAPSRLYSPSFSHGFRSM